MNKLFLISISVFSILLISSFTSCTLDNIADPSQSVNQQQLNDAFNTLGNVGGIKSIIVSQNDSIVKEQFFNSSGPDIAHDVRSVTKTVTALLIGIAIDKGYILSVEQEIGDYLTPLIDDITPDKLRIKLKYLLTMSSGLEWNEWGNYNEYNNWWNSPDQITYLLNRNIVYQPGSYFNYNSAGSNLLSIILSQASGKLTEDFAKEFLFNPLGINFQSWKKDKRGFNNGAAGLFITPYDMQKIGSLLLNNGLYKNKRIISPGWINEQIKYQISTRDANSFSNGYGYQTWLWEKSNNSCYYAMGYGGQFIIIVPTKKLVITASCEWQSVSSSTADNNWYTIINTIANYIIPAFR
jgi:CubicO group peptidase (beta-lactamase class C family)